jgi:NAD(P)-dependent dehydrogenase (short-subunit alcohol dehydrogenase family)
MVEQRVALVTGGNRGIGLEICRQLAAQGVRVVLAARDEAKARAAAESLRAEGLHAHPQALDLDDLASFPGVVAEVTREHGSLDILVNNAGIMLDKTVAALEIAPDLVERTLRTNTLGPLHLIQAVAPGMRARRYGRIVNLSSQLGQLETMVGGYPAYRVSKAALNAVTCIFAADLKRDNVLVNSMCPGWVRTAMGGDEAPRTVAEGADTALWLATLPDDGPTGGFFRDRARLPW